MGHNEHENEQEQHQESENPKLKIMWEMLSEKRQQEINMRIVNSIKKFERSGQLELGRTYPLEFTFGFDKEEPKQYVYIMCAFRIVKPEKPVQMVKNMPPAKTIMDIAMRDIEVFKEDKMYDWVDHVNRLNKNSEQNKEQQLFYEDNIFKKEKEDEKIEVESNSNDNDVKKESKENTSEKKLNNIDSNPNQCNINKPLEKEDEIELGSDMIGRAIFPSTDNKEESKYILHGIDEKSLFDFYEENVKEKTTDEYLSIFRLHSRNMVNQVMRGYYSHNLGDDKDKGENNNDSENENNEDNSIVATIDSLKGLQCAFSKCDFWKFNKYELGQLGFINWSDELMLIPIWAFPVILRNSRDKILHCPNEEKVIVKNIDIREYPNSKYGCVPFGFKINELKK